MQCASLNWASFKKMRGRGWVAKITRPMDLRLQTIYFIPIQYYPSEPYRLRKLNLLLSLFLFWPLQKIFRVCLRETECQSPCYLRKKKGNLSCFCKTQNSVFFNFSILYSPENLIKCRLLDPPCFPHPYSQFFIQYVWNGTKDSAFLTCPQVMWIGIS